MRPGHQRHSRGVVVAAALLLVASACGGPSPATTPPSAAGGLAAATPLAGAPTTGSVTSEALAPADALAAYGAGAVRDPAITYQPDVVFVGGGPAAIRWASADGLTWAVDRNAPGAADLTVGSVMFATSAAVGRVARLVDEADTRVVTLAPVELTELIKDGRLQVDQDLDLADAVFRQLPDGFPAVEPVAASPSAGPSPSAGADADPSGRTIALTLPTIRLASAHTPTAAGTSATADAASSRLSVPVKLCPEVGVGMFSVKACSESGVLSINVDAKPDQNLKLGFVIKLFSSKLHAQAGTVIENGQVIDTGGLLDGIDRVGIQFLGGVADGAQDNVKFKIEVPVEEEVQLAPVYGIPTRALVEAKFTVETAFSGRNSTLTASGVYGLDGGLGVQNGKPVAPRFSVVSSILDSMGGIPIGVSGVVFGVRWKVQVGVGVPGFLAGPYTTLSIVLGLGRGSVIGAPLAQCKGATLQISTGVGLGVGLTPSKLQWLADEDSFVSKYVKAKVEEDLLSYKLVDRKAVTPDVPLCTGHG